MTGGHPDLPREREHLAGTIDSMTRRILQLEDGLQDVGADEDTAFVQRLDNEAEAQQLSVHLKAPYFGSMLVRARGRTQRLYLGRYPYYDPQGAFTVSDWRSPVGQLFYTDAVAWDKGEIHLKRQLDVRDRELTALTDLYVRGEGAAAAEAAREEVLVRRLSEGATSGMRDIISTIQPEQAALIQAPGTRPLVIQGPAGSGKTSLLFHRVAYLAYEDRGDGRLDPKNTLVLVPNRVLAGYARRVLPDLRIEGVTVATPDDWMTEQLGLNAEVTDKTLTLLLGNADREVKRRAWLRAKALGDARMLDVLRESILRRYRDTLGREAFETTVTAAEHDYTLTYDAARLLALLDHAAASSLLTGVREAFTRRLVERAWQDLHASGVPESAYRAVLAQLEHDAARLAQRAFRAASPITEVRRLLREPGELAASARGILPDARVRALLTPDPAAHLPTARTGSVDALELPLMLAVKAVQEGIGRKNARGAAAYDHVLVDEGQDLSPLLYRLLADVAPRGAVTVAGDINQGIHGYRAVSFWTEALDQLRVTPDDQVRHLRRTYRSTRQIVHLASGVARSFSRDEAQEAEAVPRDGQNVEVLEGGPLMERAARAVRAAREAGFENVGVIVRHARDCETVARALGERDIDAAPIDTEQKRYAGGVVVIPPNLSKGLEFDAAVIVGADTASYPHDVEYETRLMYVAVTRGMHALWLLPDGELHPLLRQPELVG
ncbi:HelD family protein [Deinococcus pimensis]|uniref:HelD family protein n=1 Tax=Deinococcus pimensis TaxID=309888 RepID=UPI0004861D60|nr:UvrD-helicase domain-containing protein [Deinococcus pimensis]